MSQSIKQLTIDISYTNANDNWKLTIFYGWNRDSWFLMHRSWFWILDSRFLIIFAGVVICSYYINTPRHDFGLVGMKSFSLSYCQSINVVYLDTTDLCCVFHHVVHHQIDLDRFGVLGIDNSIEWNRVKSSEIEWNRVKSSEIEMILHWWMNQESDR
jgi:hypothetical protein